MAQRQLLDDRVDWYEMRALPALSIVLLTLVAAGEAGAQAPPQQRPGFQRDGWLIGFAVGAGEMKFDGLGHEDLGVRTMEFELGGMFRPDLAGVLHFSIAGGLDDHPQVGPDTVTRVEALFSAGARWFFLDRFWVEAGIGTCTYGSVLQTGNMSSTLESYGSGRTIYAGGAVEVYRRRSFALDVRFLASHADFGDGVAVGVTSLQLGFTWY